MNDKIENNFKVGRFTCELSFVLKTGRLDACWSPRMPKRGDLSPQDLDQYRAGRDALVREVARITGQGVLVVDG